MCEVSDEVEVNVHADVECPARRAALAMIFSVATFIVNAASLPSGFLLDRFGGMVMSMCGGVLMIAGLSWTAVLTENALPFSFAASYGLISLGGQMTLFAALPVAFIFDA